MKGLTPNDLSRLQIKSKRIPSHAKKMTTRAVVTLALLGAAASLLLAPSDAHVTLPEFAKHGELWKRVQAQSQLLFQAGGSAAELWFTQRVDHFADDAANATYQQRYYEVNSFWRKPDGPVILYIGGEGALTAAPTGFVQVLAQQFGAKVRTFTVWR